MAKLTLADIANLNNPTSVVASINANNALVEAAVENTLSRDGTTPNSMNANLDMNNFAILNCPSLLNGTVSQTISAFTPGLAIGGSSSGITYADREGKLTVTGKVACATFYLQLSSKGAQTGDAVLTGFAFPIATEFTASGVVSTEFGNMGDLTVTGWLDGVNTLTLSLGSDIDNHVQNTHINNNTFFSGTITFTLDD